MSYWESISNGLTASKRFLFNVLDFITPVGHFIAQDNFLTAVREGDILKAEKYIARGMPLTFSDGRSALNVAIESEHPHKADMVYWLVQKGADLTFPCEAREGESPLHTALIIAVEKKIEIKNNDQDIEVIKTLIQAGANIHHYVYENDLYEFFKPTVLYLAVVLGNIDIVELLLEKGADINAKNGGLLYNQEMPLIIAASEGDVKMVHYLLEHGATVDTYNPHSNTVFEALYSSALFNALLSKDIPTIQLLLERECDKNLSLSSLHIAAITNELDTLKTLLENNEDIHSVDNLGLKAIYYAVHMHHPNALQMLIDHGANVNEPFDYGDHTEMFSLLSMIVEEDPTAPLVLETVKVLFDNGAHLNEKSEETILNAALQNASYLADQDKAYEVVKLLISYGADPYLQNQAGETAFDLIKYLPNHQDVKAILMSKKEAIVLTSEILFESTADSIPNTDENSTNLLPQQPLTTTTNMISSSLPILEQPDMLAMG